MSPAHRHPGTAPTERHEAIDAPAFVRAVVVFVDGTDIFWLRGLRRGFRHCFAAIDDGRMWLTIDPLLHRLEIRATGVASDHDIAAAYRQSGLAVVPAIARPTRRRCLPFGPFTCVETVKRLLGMRAWWIVTPWQLYQRLLREAAQASALAARAETTDPDADENKIGK